MTKHKDDRDIAIHVSKLFNEQVCNDAETIGKSAQNVCIGIIQHCGDNNQPVTSPYIHYTDNAVEAVIVGHRYARQRFLVCYLLSSETWNEREERQWQPEEIINGALVK